MVLVPKRSPRRPRGLDEPYQPGDAIPVPEAVERNTDTDWALFSDLAAKQEARFAETAPASLPMALSDEERGYAGTVPAALGPRGAAAEDIPRPKPAAKAPTVDEVMALVRRNNRVCPIPARWLQLYNLLPGKRHNPLGWQPPPPLTGPAWAGTPPLSKRMCLRDHIEWAATHGALQAVYSYLETLPEAEWHHMGDTAA